MGYTGLIGGHLQAIFPTAEKYNRTNITEIRDKNFDLLLIAGLPAEKWKANLQPDADFANKEDLVRNLQGVTAQRTVLFSTVDVFERPQGVDEHSPVGINSQAYGRNRFEFEEFVKTGFRRSWILRLPGLISEDLKKNVLYDLKNHKPTTNVPINASFQFFPLSRLKTDLERVINMPEGTYHLTAEPISIRELCDTFDLDPKSFAPESPKAANYDIKTAAFEKEIPYLVTRSESLKAIREYLS